MPRLKDGAGLGNVKANLHDLVIWTEHRLADGHDPGMSGQLDESANPFRMDLHVITLRATAHNSRWSRERLGEKFVDILSQLQHPTTREGGLVSEDAVPIEAAHNTGHIVLKLVGWTGDRHDLLPAELMRHSPLQSFIAEA